MPERIRAVTGECLLGYCYGTAAAEALDGLGDRFGQSITHGNAILADLNPQMPRIHYAIQCVADLTDVYGNAAPDLFDGLENAVTFARTLNEQHANLDEALLASVGVGNTGADILERGGPYLGRSTADLISTTEILDDNSPALFCAIRNFHDVEPTIVGAGNPYVYPDNLPRVNASGGPEGRPDFSRWRCPSSTRRTGRRRTAECRCR